jgi:peptide deformylase
MSIKEIRHFGDPVLITPATEVLTFDKELRTLVRDLTETMLDAPGAGLAAPQIGVPLRVFVWDVDETIGHLINPTLDLSEEMQEGDEGCLSFPELVYPTPRAFRAVAKGFTMHGEPITVEGTELLARALQHETDHLNGILFIDRLSESDRKMAMKEIRESDWFGLAEESGISPTIKVSPHNLFGENQRGLGL